MGVVRDIVNSVDNTPTVAADIKETLGLLMSLAEAKGKAYEETIKGDLRTGKTVDDLTIAITKVITSNTECRAVTKSGITTFVDDVTESMNNLFSGDGNILKSISCVIDKALIAIMGAGEGQESQTRIYSVVTEYPAIVRFDFAFWGRNIRAQSIKDYMENVFTCVAYKSAVDVSKLAFNDFLSVYGQILRSAYGNDRTKLREMIQEAKEVYKLFNVNVTSDSLPLIARVQQASTKPFFKITTHAATEGNF